MSTVNLFIAGLALCNKTGSGAESLFFHANTHRLELKVKINGTQNQPIQLGTQNTIQVELNNATPFLPSGATSFSKIVDFDTLHKRSLCIASPPLWVMSYFSAPSDSLYCLEDSRIFELWEKIGASRTCIESSYKVGEKAAMSYQINPGGSVVMNVTNSAGITTPYPFNYGNNYDVELDNTCTTGCDSDYPLYYQMLEMTTVQYEIILPTDTGDAICNVGSGGNCASVFDYFQKNRS